MHFTVDRAMEETEESFGRPMTKGLGTYSQHWFEKYSDKLVSITYTNHRGRTRDYIILPDEDEFGFGNSTYHKETPPSWYIVGREMRIYGSKKGAPKEKTVSRDFLLTKISRWEPYNSKFASEK